MKKINSFILTFDSADFENYINGPGLDIEFDNENLGLKGVDDENLIGNQLGISHVDVVLADDMDRHVLGMDLDAFRHGRLRLGRLRHGRRCLR